MGSLRRVQCRLYDMTKIADEKSRVLLIFFCLNGEQNGANPPLKILVI